MQEKESIMAVGCKLKIPSLRINVRHHLASLVIPNSYPRDRIFNSHPRAIKDSYSMHHQSVKDSCNTIIMLIILNETCSV